MAKYDNSGRLEEDGEKDWREALNMSKDYVTEWRTFIAEPLQRGNSEGKCPPLLLLRTCPPYLPW